MSVETIGSSVYLRIPVSGPDAASFIAALISSSLVSFETSQVRSTSDPVITGARTEMPLSLPSRSGRTRPMALAAPVLVGIRLIAAARARR